jgi:uncharacterized protein (DUF305 family)
MVNTQVAAVAACLPLLAALPVRADAPGQGQTARYEISFMQMAIDHHFAALRMTELAAGTDVQRDAALSASEGTSPTPGFPATVAKGTLDDLKSLARRNNRMQREEIMTMQGQLRDWYGIHYQPHVRPDNAVQIAILERAQPGDDFNHAFYEVFGRHHYTLMEPVNGCMTGIDLSHETLRHECEQMWHSQMSDIETMRMALRAHFGIVDYQPFRPLAPLEGDHGLPRGNHSGGQ